MAQAPPPFDEHRRPLYNAILQKDMIHLEWRPYKLLLIAQSDYAQI